MKKLWKEKEKDKDKDKEEPKQRNKVTKVSSSSAASFSSAGGVISGTPVRFISALTNGYHTIPIPDGTDAEEVCHKIEQKILSSEQKKKVKLYERVVSEFGWDREMEPHEKVLELMAVWDANGSQNLFVIREFDVVEPKCDAIVPTKTNQIKGQEPPFRTEITTFLPDYVKNIYLFSLGAPNKPTSEVFPAAVMFVDIAGFTSFTEKLAKLGEIGMETLCTHMNELFGLLISVVRRFYGDVIQFGGDSVLILWESPLATLQELVLHACECGVEIQEVFADYHTRQAYAQSAGIKLSLYVAIAAGDMNHYHVGAPGKWSIVFAGDPILQIAREMGHCAPGEIVVSPEAWMILQGSASDGQKGKEILKGKRKVAGGGETRQHGGLLGLFSAKKKEVVGEEEEEMPYLLQAVRPPPGDRKASAMRKKAVTPTAAYYMRAYVSRSVLACVDTGLMDWIRELREVAVVFLNLPDLDDFESEDFLPTLQLATEILQTEITRWEGTINKFIMDDKGCLLLCGFGLPLSPTTHIATRAVAAGMNIKRLMVRAKITVTIGITVGKNYCGLIGSRQRQEYTIMGDFVNLAARLMKAKINEGVLCDERTYTTAKQFVKFAPPEEIMVKGKAKPIMAYKPLGVIDPEKIVFLCRNSESLGGGGGGGGGGVRRRRAVEGKKRRKLKGGVGGGEEGERWGGGGEAPVLGREEELDFLEGVLKEVGETKENVVVLVEGEPGMGRTTLMTLFQERIRKRNQEREEKEGGGGGWGGEELPVFYGRGLPPSISPDCVVPELSPFRDLVGDLWGGVGDGSDEAKERLEQELEKEGLDNASIFNALLDLRVPETRPASMLTKNARRKKQISLIVDRLNKLYPNEKVLIVEDISLLDALSWELIKTTVGSSSSLMVILTRDSSETSKGKTVSISPSDTFLSGLMGRETSRSMSLKPPSDDVLLSVLCHYIGAKEVPKELEEVTLETSNPRLCRDFAITAAAQKLVKVAPGGKGALSLPPQEFYEAVREPLDRITLARIDSLLSHLKLALKVASAIGYIFSEEMVHRFHPSRSDVGEVATILEELCKGGFLRRIETKEEWEDAQEQLSTTLFSTLDDVICDSSLFGGGRGGGGAGGEGSVGGKGSGRWYGFRFRRCRKVAYSALLHTTRQQLHSDFAKYYENITDYPVLRGCSIILGEGEGRRREEGKEKEEAKRLSSGARGTFSRLMCIAHHWKSSGQGVRALGYLQEIGRLAILLGDYEMAEDAYKQAQEIAEEVSFKDPFLWGRWYKGRGDALLLCHRNDSKIKDEVLEIAKDQYTKAKTAFEDHRHTVTLLQASLTPQSVLSLYGDVGRLIEETQILLYEHFPFLSPFPSPEIEQRLLFGLEKIPSPNSPPTPTDPTTKLLPKWLQGLVGNVRRARDESLVGGGVVVLERLKNSLVAAKIVGRLGKKKGEEEGKKGKSAFIQRNTIDIRLFFNFKRETWLLPYVLAEAGLLATLFGATDLAKWYHEQAAHCAEKDYDLYAVGHSALCAAFGGISTRTKSDSVNDLSHAVFYLKQLRGKKEGEGRVYPVVGRRLEYFGEVGVVLANLSRGRMRAALRKISEVVEQYGGGGQGGGMGGFEVTWGKIHCILMKRENILEGGPKMPNLDGLFQVLVEGRGRGRGGGFSLMDRFGVCSLLAKYFACQENWPQALQSVNDCMKLFDTGVTSIGSLLIFHMVSDLADALVMTANSSSKLVKMPGTQTLLTTSLTRVLEVLGGMVGRSLLYRMRFNYFEAMMMKLETKQKKFIKTLGKLIEQAEKTDFFYDLAMLYQETAHVFSGKERDTLVKLGHQISKTCGLFFTGEELAEGKEEGGAEEGGGEEVLPKIQKTSISSMVGMLAETIGE